MSSILIAEDDRDTCRLYRNALQTKRYQPIVTHDGQECLDAFYHKLDKIEPLLHNGMVAPFDALILDYKIPKKDGLEVAREILAIQPHQRIIFASAYITDTLKAATSAQLERPIELLQKPFTMTKLVDTLEDTETYAELQRIGVNIDGIKRVSPTHEQLIAFLDGIKRLGLGPGGSKI